MPDASSSASSLASAPRRRAPWRLALAVVVVTAGLWAGLRFGLPPLLQWAVEKHGSEALGRRLSVGAVEFEPGTLTLRVRDVALAAARDAGPAPQLTVARIEVDISSASLLRMAPILDAVVVEAPRLRLQHLGGGRTDLDDLRARLASPASADASAGASADTGPARFRVDAVRIEDGELSVVDAPSGARHTLAALQLRTGTISSLKADQSTALQAELQALVDNTPLRLRASGTPWAQGAAGGPSAQMTLQMALQGLPLNVLQPHWPRAWPVQLRDGALTLDLKAEVPLAAPQRSAVSGQVTVSDLRVTDGRGNARVTAPAGEALLQLQRLGITLEPSRLAEGEVRLSTLRLERPVLSVSRDARGELNLQRIARAWPQAAEPTASNVQPQLRLGLLDVDQAELLWRDGTLQPAAQLKAQGVTLAARDVQWPDLQPVPFEGQASIAGAALRWQGTASLQSADVALEVQKFALQAVAPYLAQHLQPQLGGQLGAKARVKWAAGGARAASVQVDVATLELRDLQMRDALSRESPSANPLAGWRLLRIDDAAIDLSARALRVRRVSLDQPSVMVSRSAEGRWMAQDWLRSAQAPEPPSKPASKPDPEWRWQLGELRVQGGQASLVDRLPGKAVDVAAPVEAVELNLTALALQWRGPTRPGQATPLELSAQVQPPRSRRDAAPIRYRGELRLPSDAAPLQLRGQLVADRLPLHVLEPYARDQLNLDLRRADTSWRGSVDVSLPASGVQLELRGDASIEDLRASTLSPREDLLDWKSLSLRGVEVSMADGALRRLSVAETALQDFFARVIIDSTGRINLQDLLRREPASAGGTAATPATTAPASAGASSSGAAPAMQPDIRFGPIALVNGRVFLSDRFIQPNYSANLSELTGSLGAFANAAATGGQVQMAPLALRGRAEGTATVEIVGQLNPLAQPLALDLQGRVRDLELPPLSPYSAKYAGHGIERGKLSLDLEYRITPEGQLTASNRIVLNQLIFGDRIQGSEAPNLPLRLAVALLSDRNGVIDVNLPISGTLNDPQFRLGPIIWKLVLNLIGKAITAPFALIAQAFSGGGEQASHVAFAAGSAALTEAARERLGQVAQALRDRPALQLTVVGEGDPQAEQAALQRLKLDERVRAEKRRQQARDARAAGQNVSTAALPEPTVSAQEYPALLREVYRRADIAKPRNMVGLAKDLSVPEMEALLMAGIPADANVMRDLVLARSVAVRDFLASQQIATERLFLGAPVLRSESAAGKADCAAPRAEIKLDVR